MNERTARGKGDSLGDHSNVQLRLEGFTNRPQDKPELKAILQNTCPEKLSQTGGGQGDTMTKRNVVSWMGLWKRKRTLERKLVNSE